VSAPAHRTRLRPRLLPGPLYACAGASFLIAGAGVAAWNSVHPLDHGWWLASFLALVGGIAQLLLGAGQRALAELPSLGRAHHATLRQAALWNAGTLLVPLGVLADVRLPVVAGSLVLLAALVRLAVDLRRADPPPARPVAHRRAPFVSLLAFLAVSVLVGTVLAWDLPWM
jgi:hypothetical protein